MQRHEDVLFGLEVVVERGLGDAEAVGDLAQAGAVVALVDEQVEGDVEDAIPGGRRDRLVLTGRPPRRPRPSSGHCWSWSCGLAHVSI